MRWLMILLLVSLAALLIAAGGVARHIGMHRARIRPHPASPVDSARETDLEL